MFSDTDSYSDEPQDGQGGSGGARDNASSSDLQESGETKGTHQPSDTPSPQAKAPRKRRRADSRSPARKKQKPLGTGDDRRQEDPAARMSQKKKGKKKKNKNKNKKICPLTKRVEELETQAEELKTQVKELKTLVDRMTKKDELTDDEIKKFAELAACKLIRSGVYQLPKKLHVSYAQQVSTILGSDGPSVSQKKVIEEAKVQLQRKRRGYADTIERKALRKLWQKHCADKGQLELPAKMPKKITAEALLDQLRHLETVLGDSLKEEVKSAVLDSAFATLLDPIFTAAGKRQMRRQVLLRNHRNLYKEFKSACGGITDGSYEQLLSVIQHKERLRRNLKLKNSPQAIKFWSPPEQVANET